MSEFLILTVLGENKSLKYKNPYNPCLRQEQNKKGIDDSNYQMSNKIKGQYTLQWISVITKSKTHYPSINSQKKYQRDGGRGGGWWTLTDIDAIGRSNHMHAFVNLGRWFSQNQLECHITKFGSILNLLETMRYWYKRS